MTTVSTEVTRNVLNIINNINSKLEEAQSIQKVDNLAPKEDPTKSERNHYDYNYRNIK